VAAAETRRLQEELARVNRSSLTRRRFAGLAAASLATSRLAPVAAAASAAAQEPVQGGTLVYARNLDAKTLDPHFSAQFSERYALYLIYDTLVGYDKDFNIVPELASSWDIAEDGLTITFTLRAGVMFHDGTPCDAAAVKWNFERVLNPDVNSPMRGQLAEAIESVEAPDSTTVRLNLKKAWRPILASLGERPGFIVSPTAAEQFGEELGRNPVGSGPFKFVEWVDDSHIALERNETYRDPDKPYLDRIEIRHVPEAQVQLTMVRTGEAHLIDAVPPSLLAALGDAADTVVEEIQSARFTGTHADVDKPPFDNPDLRKAIAYATDREEIRQVIYAGTGRVATHPLGGGWAYDPSLDGVYYPHDLDKAGEHLAAAGYAGESLTLTASNTQADQQLAQLLQAQFEAAGLTVKIETVNAADAFTLVKEDKTNWTLTNWAPRADPDGLLRILWHSQGFQNSTGYNNPEVDRILDEAATIYDTEEAATLYHDVERIITEDASYIFHVWPSVFAVRRQELQNFVYHPDLIIRMREFFLTS
jgi:peptide/nickel transport system substrate-binding protein